MVKVKGPTETKQYRLTWSSDLAADDTVASSVWTVPTDLTGSADTIDSGRETVITLTGGKQGHLYKVLNTVTADSGQIYSQTLFIYIEQS